MRENIEIGKLKNRDSRMNDTLLITKLTWRSEINPNDVFKGLTLQLLSYWSLPYQVLGFPSNICYICQLGGYKEGA